MDEVFGEENFVANFIWEKRTNRENRRLVSYRHDYIMCYSKKITSDSDILMQLPMNAKALGSYKNLDNDPRGPWKSDPATAQAGHGTKSQFYVLTAPNGKQHTLESGRCWLYTKEKFDEAISQGRIWFGKDGNGVPRIKTYLYEKDRGLTPESIWFSSEVSTNENAKNSLKELLDEKVLFETPKPVDLIMQILRISCAEGLVLDFFAGSGTTAHAVMQLNAEDGGNRKYILVQIPEATDEESEAYKAGYKKISDITIERVKRAAKKIREEYPEAKVDFGFKVFALGQSSFPENRFEFDVNRSDEENEAAYRQYVSKLEEQLFFEFDEEKLLYEIMTKEGFSLHVTKAREEVFAHNEVYRLSDAERSALVCLDQSLMEDTVDLVLRSEEYRAMPFVVLSRAVNSTHKWHLNQALGQNLRIV